MHWIWLAAGLLCFTAISVQRAGAQAYVGSITGVVRDPSGAVIAGASVVATNMTSGFTYPTKTNAEGIYTSPNLPPATYQITVTAPGFKGFVRPGIVIAVAQNVAVDAELELGATTQSVTVKPTAPIRSHPCKGTNSAERSGAPSRRTRLFSSANTRASPSCRANPLLFRFPLQPSGRAK